MKRYNLRFKSADRNIFEAIQNGTKTVETRAATKRYQTVNAGDTLKFTCENDSIEKTVSHTVIFRSIESLLKTYSVQKINPKVRSKEELLSMYESFPGYRQKIREYGILAMELE